MDPLDLLMRALHPGVITVMLVSGFVGYGYLLWTLDLRPNGRLVAAALFPGAIFILTFWLARAILGSFSVLYLAMFIDWLLFAASGLLAVFAWRRVRPR
jgi:hypothetical protein